MNIAETDWSRMQLNKKSNKNLFLCCSARKNFHGLNRANLSQRYILSSTKNILIFEQWYHRLQIITETPTNDATDTIVYYTRLYFNLKRSFYPDDEDIYGSIISCTIHTIKNYRMWQSRSN